MQTDWLVCPVLCVLFDSLIGLSILGDCRCHGWTLVGHNLFLSILAFSAIRKVKDTDLAETGTEIIFRRKR